MSETVFRHMRTIYGTMERSAEVENVDGVPVRVFRGSLTTMFRSTQISQAYYSRVMRALERVGSVTTIVRGGRSTESVVALHGEPDQSVYESLPADLTRRPDVAMLAERLRAIEDGKVGGIDIKTALAEHEERLSALEKPK